jgi:hypothetical protein
MACPSSHGAGLAAALRSAYGLLFKPQLDGVQLLLTCLCLAVRLKTAKSSQSMRLTFHGVQKFCFDYTGVTLDDVRTCMAALRGVIHPLSDGQN